MAAPIYRGGPPFFKPYLRFPYGVVLPIVAAGAPTDGTSGTGATKAGPGSLYVNKTSGAAYVNTGTKASPVWTQMGALASDTIYVDPNGDDVNKGDNSAAPVATLTRALALTSASRLRVRLAPGTYAEAAAVAWPTRSGIKVLGPGANFCSISATGTSVITVTPGVQTGTWTGHIEGVEIDHSAGSAQSGITFDNTGMTKKLLFGIKNCSFSADEATDKSINVATHADADNAIRVYMSGDGTQMEIGGAIYFNVNNLADRLHCEQLWLVGGTTGVGAVGAISTPNVAKEMRIRLYKCIVPLANALSGGNSTQVVTAVHCYSWVDYDDITPEVYAALATTELIGSHSEVIVA